MTCFVLIRRKLIYQMKLFKILFFSLRYDFFFSFSLPKFMTVLALAFVVLVSNILDYTFYF